MKLIDYKVVWSKSFKELSEKVIEASEHGYVLVGGVACTALGEFADDENFYQSMALYE